LARLLLGVEKNDSEGLVREEPHFGTQLRYRERRIDRAKPLR